MVATVMTGQRTWNLRRDDEGHREYTIVHQVRADALDGPAIIMQAGGLPSVGSTWNFDNDADPWAFCYPTMSISPRTSNEPNTLWTVEQKFSTKPLNRCQDDSIDNPLDEPDRISGGFTKLTKEADKDRHGDPIKSSSHEQVRGSAVQRDDNRPNVKIERNIPALPLGTFSEMVDTVNDAPLWGVSARCIKLSNVSWSRQLYGTCSFYYTVGYEFDVNFDTFDKSLIDEGTMVLDKGGNKDDPQDFIVYKDRNGENSRVILNGNGAAWDGTGTDGPGTIEVQFYDESNFLLLGVPSSL